MSKEVNWGVMVSHRSGETEDTFIADLVVGLCRAFKFDCWLLNVKRQILCLHIQDKNKLNNIITIKKKVNT
jgi:enolase